MDSLNAIRDIIEKTLHKHAEIPYSVGDIQAQTVFDRTRDHYLLVSVGWGKQCRVYGTVAHIDLVGDKIWVQKDGTEEGLAHQLVQAGIPKDKIVLGYRIPEIRKHTGYAVV